MQRARSSRSPERREELQKKKRYTFWCRPVAVLCPPVCQIDTLMLYCHAHGCWLYTCTCMSPREPVCRPTASHGLDQLPGMPGPIQPTPRPCVSCRLPTMDMTHRRDGPEPCHTHPVRQAVLIEPPGASNPIHLHRSALPTSVARLCVAPTMSRFVRPVSPPSTSPDPSIRLGVPFAAVVCLPVRNRWQLHRLRSLHKCQRTTVVHLVTRDITTPISFYPPSNARQLTCARISPSTATSLATAPRSTTRMPRSAAAPGTRISLRPAG